jgi:succinate dehydrogenase / fumarate reductase flavoprotein subunit
VDILVFGDIAGRNAALKSKEKIVSRSGIEHQIKEELKRVGDLYSESGKQNPVTVPSLRRKHCEMMDANMGVMRTEEGMKTMLKEIERAKDEDLPNLLVRDNSRLYNYELRDALEVPFRLSLEEMSTRAALKRKESRGSHYREDFPKRNDEEWLKNIVFHQKDGETKIEVRDVVQSQIRLEDLSEYFASDSPWH